MPRGVAKNPAGKRLSEKQQRFALIYTDPGVKGRNAVTAYVEAGYASLSRTGKPDKTLRSRAYEVLHGPGMTREVKRILDERQGKVDARDKLTVDQVRHEHWQLYDQAITRTKDSEGKDIPLSASDLGVANQILMAIGKTIGAYIDKTEIDVGRQVEYTETQRVEMLRISRLLLEEEQSPAPVLEHPVIEAEPVPAVEPAPGTEREQQAPGEQEQRPSVPEQARDMPEDMQEGTPFTPKGGGAIGGITCPEV